MVNVELPDCFKQTVPYRLHHGIGRTAETGALAEKPWPVPGEAVR